MTRFLLERGADPNGDNSSTMPAPVLLACDGSKTEILRLLL
jgi:hypothetical protein